jgi:branched-chain amino acid transport system ATP-binding protein
MLELAAVRGGYEGTEVIHGVSMSVPDGAVVAVLGPNGAGKTTLLRILSGILPVGSGIITLDGADISRARPYARARLGMCTIPEGRAVFRALTVRENLLLFAKPKERQASLEMAMAAFPALRVRLKVQAGNLSGGERQMLALARAYVTSPRLMLLDEVSMGLAPKVVDQVYDFIRLLVDRGTSLLLVEQFIGKALGIADYAVVLSQGVVAYSGPASTLTSTGVYEMYLGGPAGPGSVRAGEGAGS